MAFKSLLLLAFAAVATADTVSKPRPNPKLNANPTDTSNPRLNGKQFPFNNLPEKADTSGPQPNVNFRGEQIGYNRCNSTTEGQASLCQTIVLNSVHDFCFFAPREPNSAIGDTEGEEVAWCSQPGHGTRVIPPGTITGLQFIRTQSYVALTGIIKGAQVNIQKGSGGELDSGGQDQRGNPIGGLAYSNSLPSSNGQYVQSRAWHLFIGSDLFCMKLCDPKAPNASGLCEHTFDTIGCNYNVPAAYQDGAFLSCAGEDQDPVGVYTGADGQVSTMTHPGEGEIPNPPFTPRIPATSSCTTFASAGLFATTWSDAAPVPATTTASSSSSASTTTVSSSLSTGTTKASTSSGTKASSTGSASGSATSPVGTDTGAAGALAPAGALLSSLIAGAALLIGAAVFA